MAGWRRCIVQFSAPVRKGDVIFRLDNAKQEASMETARRKIAEVDAAMLAAPGRYSEGRRAGAGGQGGPFSKRRTNSDIKRELQKRNPGIVPQRDIEKLEVLQATAARARSTRPWLRDNPR